MTYDMVSLGPDEWGNETMREVARQHFAAHPDCQFVEVREHAGWYLGYRRDMTMWSTANDAAWPLLGTKPQRFSGVHVWRESQAVDNVTSVA